MEVPAAWWDDQWQGLNLSDTALSQFSLSDSDLSKANLQRTDITGGVGRGTRFDGALIEEARFNEGDFSGSSFRAAVAGQASFQGAMLEDARFEAAHLRFARFQTALLDGADFEGADAWGADFSGADADRTIFRKARLDEANLSDVNLTYSDFAGASLKGTKLRGSRLRGANFTGATLGGTDFEDADLSDTRLIRLDLSSCNLRRARFNGAWMEGCRIRIEQLGGALGEEIDKNYDAARGGYAALEANFTSIGAKAEAGWAYKKGRKMGCLGSRAKAREAIKRKDWSGALPHIYAFASDRFVEWLCDYGESMSRIFRAFVVLIAIFAVLYGVLGGLVPQGHESATRNLIDIVSYSALNMMTSNPPEIGMTVVGRTANILVGLQGALGIILMGLFGFILGNRIRR
ncbi:pentapeptide repeat-containing protein [Aureimonas phyllosphaerae]|uniref:Uncharacterized protein YjbI with pentapeptide repeats n=1 Tax=Aureimonas phyllosphaerae TaxID=1166078 RepID=A0A7W6BZU7_9HYPH|nr:pentapeptide repeat-containing protein [Aureimonas phyllosphaerae]MBB3938233.1 uncharacterized protein YjbI with pentapeptide repeats [Aureimonas phyllosphaerae]MBB3962240.1 uncharacterized protein YjbI with pentapeptide repeats [Aureimonas phyllosphaerae]SFF59702.1 Uncharacterized protein YjbI, contains pentapeptide repeats [Aureimonas phyllosphaerae]